MSETMHVRLLSETRSLIVRGVTVAGMFCAVLTALPAQADKSAAKPRALLAPDQAVLHRLVERADDGVRWIRDPYRRFDLRRQSATKQAPRVLADRSLLLDAALSRARFEKRLVLAYLPRIEGRPMYRAPVVDDYMRLAIWADPSVQSFVNRRFVPLRIYADTSVAERLGLGNADSKSPGYLEALEPAVLFLAPNGEVVHRIDRIRTFSARWFEAQLRKVLEANPNFAGPSLALRLARAQIGKHKEPTREGPSRGESHLRSLLWLAEQALDDGGCEEASRALGRFDDALRAVFESSAQSVAALERSKPAGDGYPAWAARWRSAQRQAERFDQLAVDGVILRSRVHRAMSRARKALERLDALSGKHAALALARGDFALERARCFLALAMPEDARGALALTREASGEAEWMRGVAYWLVHDRDEAAPCFRRAVQHAEQPWASRAAAMLAISEDTTRRSPLAHGFEMLREASRSVLRGSAATSTELSRDFALPELRSLAVHDALRYLLEHQLPDGSWSDARYAYWPSPKILPNVRVAVTALAATALLSWRDFDRVRIDAALERAKRYLSEDGRLALGTEEEVYSQAYRILFWTRCARARWGSPEMPRAKLAALVKRAAAIQDKASGFFAHEYKNAFCTASMMWSLHGAARFGVAVDEDMLQLGVAALRSARRADGSFAYGGSAAERDSKRPPASSITRLKDASARMPICEGVLQVFGASDPKRVHTAFETFLTYLDRLERVRKADFHSDGQLAGFFFWHAIFHASEAMRLCKDTQRQRVRQRLTMLCSKIQEIDGSFVDSHELGKSYGTAMGLLTLANLRD